MVCAMRNVIKFLSFAAVAVSLSACASCPRVSDYGDTPYEERTAGQGVVVYDGNCNVEQRTETVREAEPVFQKKARK